MKITEVETLGAPRDVFKWKPGICGVKKIVEAQRDVSWVTDAATGNPLTGESVSTIEIHYDDGRISSIDRHHVLVTFEAEEEGA